MTVSLWNGTCLYIWFTRPHTLATQSNNYNTHRKNHTLFSLIGVEASEKLRLPVLLLKLGEQLNVIWTELARWRWREGRGGQRRRRGGGSGLQRCGRGHLASHLTDGVRHRVLYPWESRTQLTCNLVCRHLQRMERGHIWVHNHIRRSGVNAAGVSNNIKEDKSHQTQLLSLAASYSKKWTHEIFKILQT